MRRVRVFVLRIEFFVDDAVLTVRLVDPDLETRTGVVLLATNHPVERGEEQDGDQVNNGIVHLKVC